MFLRDCFLGRLGKKICSNSSNRKVIVLRRKQEARKAEKPSLQKIFQFRNKTEKTRSCKNFPTFETSAEILQTEEILLAAVANILIFDFRQVLVTVKWLRNNSGSKVIILIGQKQQEQQQQ